MGNKPPSIQASEYAELTVTAYVSLPTPITVDTLIMMVNNAYMAGFKSGMKETGGYDEPQSDSQGTATR